MTVVLPITKAGPKESLGAALRAFWQGFSTASPLALTLTVVACLLSALIVCVVVTPAMLAGPAGTYLPRSANDSEAFATREALRLAAVPPAPQVPRLTVISNSMLAQAFANDARLAATLRESTGGRWQVTFLTTPLQGPIDEAGLADYAGRYPGIVVLALGFQRYGADSARLLALEQDGRLGLRSDWADAAVVKLGGTPRPRTGIYAIDNGSFLLRNAGAAALRWLAGRPAIRRIDSYLPVGPLPPAQLAVRRAVILDRLHRGIAASDRGIAIQADTVARLRAAGNTVILAEEPVSSSLLDTPGDRARYAAYIARSAALARQMGGFYCRLPAPAAAAFPDLIHVGDPAAQRTLRETLARCVAAAPPPRPAP